MGFAGVGGVGAGGGWVERLEDEGEEGLELELEGEVELADGLGGELEPGEGLAVEVERDDGEALEPGTLEGGCVRALLEFF
jgi:hypothetical protein